MCGNSKNRYKYLKRVRIGGFQVHVRRQHKSLTARRPCRKTTGVECSVFLDRGHTGLELVLSHPGPFRCRRAGGIRLSQLAALAAKHLVVALLDRG